MKIQVEYMSLLLVIRILGKTYSRTRSYLLSSNKRYNVRRMVDSEKRRMGVRYRW